MTESLTPFEIPIEDILAISDHAERDMRLRQVAAIKAKVKANPLWGFRPHEGERERKGREGQPLDGSEMRGQLQFLEQNREQIFLTAVVAGSRFGKTTIGAVDNLIQLLGPTFVPPWLEVYRRRPYLGEFKCRTIVVDLPNALQKVWLPKLRKLIPPAALQGGSFRSAWKDRDRILYFADGGWWDFLSHDMDFDSFAGADLDRVHIDEEMIGEDGKLKFEESITRLTDRDGDIKVTMTPLQGIGWMHSELFTRDNVALWSDEVRTITGSMADNPSLSQTAQDRLKKRWAKEPSKLAARMHGIYVHREGLVYEEFRDAHPDQGGHVVPDRDPPRQHSDAKPWVPIYAAIDPGISHPMGLLFAWMNPDDVLEVFYAHKWAGKTVEFVAERYHDVVAGLGIKPRWTVIDPAAKQRNPQTGRNVQQIFTEHSVHTIAGHNARSAGIDRIKERLLTGRLVIHAGEAQELIHEFLNHRWKRAKRTEESPKDGEVVKVDDDLLDPLRYLLMSLPQSRPEPEEAQDKSAAQLAFEHSLKISGRPRRYRVGATRV